ATSAPSTVSAARPSNARPSPASPPSTLPSSPPRASSSCCEPHGAHYGSPTQDARIPDRRPRFPTPRPDPRLPREPTCRVSLRPRSRLPLRRRTAPRFSRSRRARADQGLPLVLRRRPSLRGQETARDAAPLAGQRTTSPPRLTSLCALHGKGG